MQGRQREDQLASPLTDVCKLFGELGLEVPRQCKHDIGPILRDLFWLVDRNPRARRESTVLVWVAVHRVLEQVAADTAVVQQCVALAGCAVADDPLPFGAAVE